MTMESAGISREHQHRLVGTQHGVFHQVHGEGGLAHGRTAGNDDQVGRLQAAGGFVQIGETGGQAGDRLASIEQGVDAVDGLDQNVVDADRPTGLRSRFGNLEDQSLGFVEDLLAGAALRGIGAVGDRC